MPTLEEAKNKVVRVNDGNDSCVKIDLVMEAVKDFPMKFYNTSICSYPKIEKFDAPFVLTVNPGNMTDSDWHKLFVGYHECGKKLMFVRFRTNMWNLSALDEAINYYTHFEIPVVLTFMAYYSEDSIPEQYRKYYVYRKRTLNSYWAITTAGLDMVMSKYKYNSFVYSCGRVEGELGTTCCKRCGNCLREYFNAIEKMK